MVGRVGGVPCRLLWKGVPDSEMVDRVGIEEREVKLMAEMGGGDRLVRLMPDVVAGQLVWHEDSVVLAFFFFLLALGTYGTPLQLLFWCACRWVSWLKRRWQDGHSYGFSPVDTHTLTIRGESFRSPPHTQSSLITPPPFNKY